MTDSSEPVTRHLCRGHAASGRRPRRLAAAGVVPVIAAAAAAGAAVGPASADAPQPGRCPVLQVYGVQGTGESSPDAAPTTDSGFLGSVFRPMLLEGGTSVARDYIPYQASFGGFVFTSGGDAPYAQSVAQGLTQLRNTTAAMARRCPNTRFGVIGYSQGAHVVSQFLQEVGSGQGVIGPDRLAAGALFGDPTRGPNADVFPGAAGKVIPDPSPGTAGTAVSGLAPITTSRVTGQGIGPDRDVATDFGAVTGRVASFCASGDLACAAPDHAPVLKAVADVAGQADFGGDPIKALLSVTEALGTTAIKTGITVLDQDVQGDSLDTLSYSPQESISQRIADASDPRTPIDVDAGIRGLFKVATIGLNAVITVAQTVLAPDSIAELAAAGLANPAAGLAMLGTKLVAALPQLIPPDAPTRLIS